jgi:hypothetical protein
VSGQKIRKSYRVGECGRAKDGFPDVNVVLRVVFGAVSENGMKVSKTVSN